MHKLKFQSTLPCGSDGIFRTVPTLTRLFQSTLPCGSDYGRRRFPVSFVTISIHAPLRERLSKNLTAATSAAFQSTLPHGSDLCFFPFMPGKHIAFQSTLPHGSDDRGDLFEAVGDEISIHAPSRERLHLPVLRS